MNAPENPPDWGSSYRLIAADKWKAKSAVMGRDATVASGMVAIVGRFQLALVFVVMAVQAQQFPVAAIGRVVMVVVVAVMHRQFAHIGLAEFPPTATADPGVDL